MFVIRREDFRLSDIEAEVLFVFYQFFKALKHKNNQQI